MNHDLPPAPAPDYDALMQANLARVFGEHDPARRIDAIAALYHQDATLYEPERSVRGHAAISQAVTDVLAQLPPGLAFVPLGPAIGHHGLGRMQWRAMLPGGATVVTGMDVAQVEGGRIRSLHVFVDQPPPADRQ